MRITLKEFRLLAFIFIGCLSPYAIADDATLVKDINPGSSGSNPYSSIYFAGSLFFSANDGVNGSELWRSNGTLEDTLIFKDLNPGVDSGYPDEMIIMNNVLYFGANDGQLWRSNGTPEGTTLVKGVNPDGDSAIRYLTVVGNLIFFQADDGIHGDELWASDGTAEGTNLVEDIRLNGDSRPERLFSAGDRLYFIADDGSHGKELWRSDGSAAGTYMVHDINIGIDGSFPSHFAVLNNIMYFSAYDGWTNHATELWRTDGTDNGTYILKDINPDGNSSPLWLTLFGNLIYFQADDGSDLDKELWVTDGTADGTVLFKDIKPLGGINASSTPEEFTVIGDTMYFFADDGAHGKEPWMTDGTYDGTQILKDINPGTPGSSTRFLTPIGDMFYMVGNSDTNYSYELWKSDGTADGTVLLKKFIDQSAWNYPSRLVAAGNTLYFSSDAEGYGAELWKYNFSPVISEGSSISIIMDEDASPTPFSLSLNATDGNGDTLTWSISSPASKGTAEASGTGTSKTIAYTPDQDESGSDSFVVQVSDSALSDSFTVYVTINPVDDAPVIAEAPAIEVIMDEDGTPVAFDLTLNASDGDGDILTWSISSNASKGIATASGTGYSKVVEYTPNPDETGNDSFTVLVSDSVYTDTVLVNVVINPVNDPPVFSLASIEFIDSTSLVGQVSVSDVDNDLASITFQLIGGDDMALFELTVEGELSFITAPDLSNPLDANGDNEYEIIIRISDGTDSVEQAITIIPGGCTFFIIPADDDKTAIICL